MTNIYSYVDTMLVDTDEHNKPFTRAAMVTAIAPDCAEWLNEALIDDQLDMPPEQRAFVTRLLATAVVDSMRWSFERECEVAQLIRRA